MLGWWAVNCMEAGWLAAAAYRLLSSGRDALMLGTLLQLCASPSHPWLAPCLTTPPRPSALRRGLQLSKVMQPQLEGFKARLATERRNVQKVNERLKRAIAEREVRVGWCCWWPAGWAAAKRRRQMREMRHRCAGQALAVQREVHWV